MTCTGIIGGPHDVAKMVIVHEWKTETGRRRQIWQCPACHGTVWLDLVPQSDNDPPSRP